MKPANSGTNYYPQMLKMNHGFHDDRKIYDFGHEFLVKCPQCSKCARVVDKGAAVSPRLLLACPACGFNKSRDYTGAFIGAPVDWYFRLPVWLQTPCCGHTLWAYNHEHLAFIEQFVSAKQRINQRGPLGWSNKQLANRLPRWMKLAKNRAQVLQCIRKLQGKTQ